MEILLKIHAQAYDKALQDAIASKDIETDNADIYTAALNAYIENFNLLSISENVAESVLSQVTANTPQ